MAIEVQCPGIGMAGLSLEVRAQRGTVDEVEIDTITVGAVVEGTAAAAVVVVVEIDPHPLDDTLTTASGIAVTAPGRTGTGWIRVQRGIREPWP